MFKYRKLISVGWNVEYMSIKGYVCFYFLGFEYIYVKFKSFN